MCRSNSLIDLYKSKLLWYRHQVPMGRVPHPDLVGTPPITQMGVPLSVEWGYPSSQIDGATAPSTLKGDLSCLSFRVSNVCVNLTFCGLNLTSHALLHGKKNSPCVEKSQHSREATPFPSIKYLFESVIIQYTCMVIHIIKINSSIIVILRVMSLWIIES